MQPDDLTPSSDDEGFAAWLTTVLADPAPPDLVERSIALGTLLGIDEEFAELTNRSSTDANLAGVRAGSVTATFTFETADRVIEVEIDATSGRLRGQVLPPSRATVRVETPDGTAATTTADRYGVFSMTAAISGPVSFVIEFEDRTVTIRTRWLVIP